MKDEKSKSKKQFGRYGSVREVTQSAALTLAMAIADERCPYVSVMSFDTDGTPHVVVNVRGVEVKLVPRYDGIRRARIACYSSMDTTRPYTLGAAFSTRPDVTVFTDSASDDPTEQFLAMVGDLVLALMRRYERAYEVQTWYSQEDFDDGKPASVKAVYSDSELASKLDYGMRELPSAFNLKLASAPHCFTFASKVDPDGTVRTVEAFFRPNLLSDFERGRDGVALVEVDDVRRDTHTSATTFSLRRLVKITDRAGKSGSPLTRPCCDVMRADGHEYGVNWGTDTFRIIGAFVGTPFEVISADFAHTQVKVRHDEYGDFTVDRFSDHDFEFVLSSDDLNASRYVGVWEDDELDDMLWDKVNDGIMTDAEADAERSAETDRQVRKLPETIAKMFKECSVAIIDEDAKRLAKAVTYVRDDERGVTIGNRGFREDDLVDGKRHRVSAFPNKDCYEEAEFVSDDRFGDEDGTFATRRFVISYTSDGGETFEEHTRAIRRVK